MAEWLKAAVLKTENCATQRFEFIIYNKLCQRDWRCFRACSGLAGTNTGTAALLCRLMKKGPEVSPGAFFLMSVI